MFRTLAIRTGLICLALAPFAASASAQVKVAVINTQKAMAESDELKKASALVEAKYKPKQDELLFCDRLSLFDQNVAVTISVIMVWNRLACIFAKPRRGVGLVL